MLYCMALTETGLRRLSREIRRTLRPGGMDGHRSRHKTDPHFRKGVHQGVDPYETGGFIVPFFDRGEVKRLSAGYDIPAIDEFEEGELPRKLFMVALQKK